MKVKVHYSFITTLGEDGYGSVTFTLPDTNFVDQFEEFSRQMHKLASDNRYDDLYDTEIEIVE